MIPRLTVILLVLATTLHAGDMQSEDEIEGAKKERMYQEWRQALREALAQTEANLPAGERHGLTNFAESSYGEKMVRDIFEAAWIHSSFGMSWDQIPAPTIRGSNATVGVETFIAEHGWNMLTNATDFLFLITLERRGKPLRGLPWDVLKERTFKAATHQGILYIPLRDHMPMGSSGLAYNPQTNRFHSVRDYRPIGDHWYVWKQTDTASDERSWYEGEMPGSANQALEPMETRATVLDEAALVSRVSSGLHGSARR
jgi:hypothetical protein